MRLNYKFIKTLFISSLLLVVLSTSGCQSNDQLTDSIKLSAEYIDNYTKPDGMFDYEVDLFTGKVSDRSYNILRHAGTIYALANSYEFYKSKKSLKTLLDASNYMKLCCIGPVEDNNDILGVWSYKSINKSMPYDKLKLGGTGLGLVALLSVEQLKPGTTDKETLRKLGNFIIFLQKADGSFYSRNIPSKGGKDDSWTSLYYPGEAALGLVMLYEYDQQPKWFNHALKVLTYLSELRINEKNVPHDHWALLATAKLIEIADKQNLEIPREMLLSHGKQIVNDIITGIPTFNKTDPKHGCLSRGCRTTPSSTRLEGLIAFYNVLGQEDQKTKEKIAEVSKNGIEFLIRTQVKEGPYRGAIPPVYIGDVKNLYKTSRSMSVVRIDYVQHALSAFVDYKRVFGNL